MKKYINYILGVSALITLYSCGKNEVKPEVDTDAEQTISIKLAADFAVARYNVISIDPEVIIDHSNGIVPKYKWSIKATDKDGAVNETVIGDAKTLQFIAAKADDYVVDFTVTSGKVTKQVSTKVKVSETNNLYNSKALLLVDYLPGPAYNNGNFDFTDKNEVFTKIQENLEAGESIQLGTFGGYIVTKFDHTVINTYNKRDFTVNMEPNVDYLKYSPVSIYVAYDANKNGTADDNEWYEIAGSEYQKSTTVKNYEITYYKPDATKATTAGSEDWQFDTQYLKWTDNKTATGFITRTKKWRRYHYYPQWVGDSYTLKGTKVQLPVKDVSDGTGIAFNVGTFDWGYGGIKDPSIDISWAVDSNGKKVHLPGIDFVKVYVSTFVEIGASDLLTAYFIEAEDLNF